ncbi:hypothetical protein AVEN_33000-1 [Araneus ventricosus]|uniref:Uncharacterized protein n=1 Tax=Araneus ventricosus TaxID=182803 RepID=A0A4Y2MXR3_ARAVE|nr:hypothetical protein AVEN_33000-1 [Araneus ventricosus]
MSNDTYYANVQRQNSPTQDSLEWGRILDNCIEKKPMIRQEASTDSILNIKGCFNENDGVILHPTYKLIRCCQQAAMNEYVTPLLRQRPEADSTYAEILNGHLITAM